MGKSNPQWKVKATRWRCKGSNQAFINVGTTFPSYKNGVLRLKTLKTVSLTFLSLKFLLGLSLFDFLHPLSSSPLPSFIVVFSFSLSSAGFSPARLGGYLSHHPTILSFFDHEVGLLGGVFTVQASHLAFNMADIGWGISLMQRWLFC